VITPKKFTHKFYYYLLIFIELYFSNQTTHLFQCDDTRGCVMQFWPPDDEYMCSKHVEAWNKLTVKQKFCAWSWSVTEINNYSCVYNTLPSKTLRMMKCFVYYEQKVSFKLQICLCKLENGDVKVQCNNAIRRKVTARNSIDNTHSRLYYLKFITSALLH